MPLFLLIKYCQDKKYFNKYYIKYKLIKIKIWNKLSKSIIFLLKDHYD